MEYNDRGSAKMMTISEYAKSINVTYKTAWLHVRRGLLKCKKTATGRILIDDKNSNKTNAMICVCGSSDEDNQKKIEQCKKSCQINKLNVFKIVKNNTPENSALFLEEAFKNNEWNILFVSLEKGAKINVKRLIEILLSKIDTNKKIIWV